MSTNGDQHDQTVTLPTVHRAPAGGVRLAGKWYREGEAIPTRYGREKADGELSRDPAASVKAPPNFGRFPIPHILSFNGMMTTIAQAYRNPDEAIKHSRENAIVMRKDCVIMECLEARQRGSALLNWHLECEDPKSPRQQQLAERLTAAIKRIPRFTEYRRNLLEATWFGRYGIQNSFDFDEIGGKRQLVIKEWRPIHGDKLLFRYDDGSGKYDDRQIGIKVYGGAYQTGDVLAGRRVLEQTDNGMGYFFEPWERKMIVVHRHMIEDAAYEDPLSSGSIHGIGIRSRIYWTWWQKQEALGMLMEFLQRSAMGIWVYYFPSGNKIAEGEVTTIAKNQSNENVVIMPKTPGVGPGEDGYGIERVECDPSGVASLKEIVNEFFGHQIKRYIMGQTLTTEAAATGLGSGVSDAHRETFNDIIRYDSGNLDETLTAELVEHLKNWTDPDARNVRVWFRSDTKQIDLDARLSAIERVWGMGAQIKESEIMEIVDLTIPTDDDRILQNPAMQQQQRLWEAAHQNPAQQQPAGGAVGAGGGEQPGSEQDMFGPALSAAQQLTAGDQGQGQKQGQPVDPTAGYQPQIVAHYTKKGWRLRYRMAGDESGEDVAEVGPATPEPKPAPSPADTAGNQPPGGFDSEVDLGPGDHDQGEDTDPNLGDTLTEPTAVTGQAGGAETEPKPSLPGAQPFAEPPISAESPEASQALAPKVETDQLAEPEYKPAPIVQPQVDATTPQQRHDFARGQMSQVHPLLARAFNSFHQSGRYRGNEAGPAGEYFAHHVAEQGAMSLYQQLSPKAGQEWGGGQVVDLSHHGEGWLGVSTPAGAMVLIPPVGPAGKWRATYTVNTGPVRRAMQGQALWPPNVGANAPQTRKFWQPIPTNPPRQPIPQRGVLQLGKMQPQPAQSAPAQPPPLPQQAQQQVQQPAPSSPTPPPLPGQTTQAGQQQPAAPPITAARYRETASVLKAQLDALTEAHDAAIRKGASYDAMNAHRKDIRQARSQWKEADRIAKDSEREEAAAVKQQEAAARKQAIEQQAAAKQAAKAQTAGTAAAPGSLEAAAQPAETLAHTLTRDEFVAAGLGKAGQHKQAVKDALSAGGQVPVHVLKEYPELILAAARTKLRQNPPIVAPTPSGQKAPEIKHAVPTFDQTRELKEYGHGEEAIGKMSFDEAKGHIEAGRTAAREKQAVEATSRPAQPTLPPQPKPRQWSTETVNAVESRTQGAERELAAAGLPVTDAAKNAIYELFDRQLAVDGKGLRKILATAAKKHAAGNVNLDPTANILAAAQAHANRRESRVDTAAAIASAALENEVDGGDLASMVEDVWAEKNDTLKGRERLKSDIRSSLGMDAGTIARLENQGLDYTANHPKLAGFDAKARNLAGSHPELFTGGGYEQEGGTAANYAEQLWNILREGAKQPLAKHHPDVIEEAVRRLRSLSGSEMTPEQRAEMEKVPFSRRANKNAE